MPKYTIELDEVQHKVFNHFHNPQDWAEILFVNRANVAMQELFRVELTKAKLNGKLVPADIEQAILNSDEKSIVERNAEAHATGPMPNQLHEYHVAQGENNSVDPLGSAGRVAPASTPTNQAPDPAPGVVRL